MSDKKIGAIKIDFLNSRLEMSPNMKVLKKKAQSITDSDENEEVVLFFEIENNDMSKTEYKAYSLFKDEIEDDEPFDLDNPWYKDESVANATTSTDATSSEKPKAVSKKEPEPKPKPASPELQKLQVKLNQIKDMIAELDQKFQDGKIEQDAYLKKKDYLAQKAGTLMGQIEKIEEDI
ncbi:MAG: hypothetical protein ACOC44_02045 [Promethearchaeia archaeon]